MYLIHYDSGKQYSSEKKWLRLVNNNNQWKVGARVTWYKVKRNRNPPKTHIGTIIRDIDVSEIAGAAADLGLLYSSANLKPKNNLLKIKIEQIDVDYDNQPTVAALSTSDDNIADANVLGAVSFKCDHCTMCFPTSRSMRYHLKNDGCVQIKIEKCSKKPNNTKKVKNPVMPKFDETPVAPCDMKRRVSQRIRLGFGTSVDNSAQSRHHDSENYDSIIAQNVSNALDYLKGAKSGQEFSRLSQDCYSNNTYAQNNSNDISVTSEAFVAVVERELNKL